MCFLSNFSRFFQYSQHIPGPTVCISHFPHLSGSTTYFTSYSVFLIYHDFSFLAYSRSFSVHFSFFTFLVFLAIFHVLHCVFLILPAFQFSRHIPGSTVCISHFRPFSVFLAIIQVKVFLTHFPRFSVFAP